MFENMLIWVAIGAASAFSVIMIDWLRGHSITINDLRFMLLFSLMGPIGTLFIVLGLLEDHRDRVILSSRQSKED